MAASTAHIDASLKYVDVGSLVIYEVVARKKDISPSISPSRFQSTKGGLDSTGTTSHHLNEDPEFTKTWSWMLGSVASINPNPRLLTIAPWDAPLSPEDEAQLRKMDKEIAMLRKRSSEIQERLAQDVEAVRQKQPVVDILRGPVERRLAEVAPLLEAARIALGSITDAELSLLRNFKTAPDPVHKIFECVMRLVGKKTSSWDKMRAFIRQDDFMAHLLGFNGRSITNDSFKSVKKILETDKDVSLDRCTSAARPAGPIFEWVAAQMRFRQVLDEMGKYLLQYEEARDRLERLEEKRTLTTDELNYVTGRLDELAPAYATIIQKNNADEAGEDPTEGAARSPDSQALHLNHSSHNAANASDHGGDLLIRGSARLGTWRRRTGDRATTIVVLKSAALYALDNGVPPHSAGHVNTYVLKSSVLPPELQRMLFASVGPASNEWLTSASFMKDTSAPRDAPLSATENAAEAGENPFRPSFVLEPPNDGDDDTVPPKSSATTSRRPSVGYLAGHEGGDLVDRSRSPWDDQQEESTMEMPAPPNSVAGASHSGVFTSSASPLVFRRSEGPLMADSKVPILLPAATEHDDEQQMWSDNEAMSDADDEHQGDGIESAGEQSSSMAASPLLRAPTASPAGPKAAPPAGSDPFSPLMRNSAML